MTSFFNQFNFDPAETSIKTTSYTIPEGRYALAIPLDSRCTLNSIEQFLVAGQTITASGGGINIPIPAAFSGKIVGSGAGNKTIVASMFITATTVSTLAISSAIVSGSFYLKDGTILNSNISANNTSTWIGPRGYYLAIASSGGVGQFFTEYLHPIWVKEGAVLAGSSWSVAEYNKIL